jgi:hypothetical protein
MDQAFFLLTSSVTVCCVLGNTRLEAIQRAFNHGIPLAFKLVPEGFVT